MSSEHAIEIKSLSKIYKLGEIGSKTFSEEIKRWFTRKNSIQIGANDRSQAQSNETHVWALKGLDLAIEEGEVVGVIGKNGAGKSTLLKLLSRITSPSEGRITIHGRIGALLEVGTGFQPDLTGRENVYLNGAILGMTKAEIDEKIDQIVAFSGCAKYIDTPVKRYSSGMTVRLGFSVAAHLEPEILIIDEVLAVGDQEFQDQCIKKMKSFARQGKTVIFVSHNMASVKSLCNRGIVLEKGELAYDGDINDAIQFYLSRQNKINEDGTVPIGAGEIVSENCRFSRIQLKGSISSNFSSALYGENIQINCEIYSAIEQEVNLEFLLNTQDNYPIASICNAFDNRNIKLNKGDNTVQLSFRSSLNPGTYSFSPAIALTNGKTLHSLPNYIDFKVEHAPINKEQPYPFVWINSPMQINSDWSTNN